MRLSFSATPLVVWSISIFMAIAAQERLAAQTDAEQQHWHEFRTALKYFQQLGLDEFRKEYGDGLFDQTTGNDGRSVDSESVIGAHLEYDPAEAQYFDAIRAAYSLSEEQQASYRRNGFVILDNAHQNSFLNAFYAVFQKDVPVYISADSILDSLHLSFGRMLKELEEDVLLFPFSRMLEDMHKELHSMEIPEDDPQLNQALDDARFWVCTARSLLAGQQVESTRDVNSQVRDALQCIATADVATVRWFGTEREEDFSQFQPRGHYHGNAQLERYFRAMMWCQRIGFEFGKSPRQAAAAQLLCSSLQKSAGHHSWRQLDGVVGVFMGSSDSTNVEDWWRLAKQVGIESAGDFFQPDKHQRFVNAANESGAGAQQINSQILLSSTGELGDFRPLPLTFHVIGQRFAVDSFVFSNVVFDRVPRTRDGHKRTMPSPLDAMFVLGNRAVVPLLDQELETYHYHPNLAALEWLVSQYDDQFWSDSLYNLWLSSLRELNGEPNASGFPSVMQSNAWQRRMLNAQLASWSQFRHDSVLYKKATYVAGECDYPHGWVDPYPEFYRAVAQFADLASKKLAEVNVRSSEISNYLSALSGTSRTLEQIARAELEGKELTVAQIQFFKRWIFVEGSSAAVFDGTYPRMIFRAQRGAMWGMGGEPFDPTVADIHTDPFTGEILHVGVAHPNLMVLSINTPAANRAYVGPVLSYYEFRSNDMRRLTDSDWKSTIEAGKTPPRPAWTQDFIR